jgi:hypothetical protein
MGSSRKNNLDLHQTKNPDGESENDKLVEKGDGKPDPTCQLNPYFHYSSFFLSFIHHQTLTLDWTHVRSIMLSLPQNHNVFTDKKNNSHTPRNSRHEAIVAQPIHQVMLGSDFLQLLIFEKNYKITPISLLLANYLQQEPFFSPAYIRKIENLTMNSIAIEEIPSLHVDILIY